MAAAMQHRGDVGEQAGEEETSTGPMPIGSLDAHGVDVRAIKALKEAGYHTLESVVYTPKKTLLEVKGISEPKLAQIMAVCLKFVSVGFQSATEAAQSRKQMVKLTTGSEDLDELLKGGIETGSMTELFGEFRTGKTQICHTLCVTSQLPIGGGGCEGKALYIDTEGTFRPERIEEIALRFGIDPVDALENVSYAKAYNSEHQMKLLEDAAALMCESKYGLVVVDSATALFRTEYTGRGQLADRQQKLALFLRKLQRLSDEFGVAVVITNQVTAKVDSGASMFGPQTMPIGGNIIAHASTTRLSLRKGKAESRICKVYDSPCLAEGEATFGIGQGGIESYKA